MGARPESPTSASHPFSALQHVADATPGTTGGSAESDATELDLLRRLYAEGCIVHEESCAALDGDRPCGCLLLEVRAFLAISVIPSGTTGGSDEATAETIGEVAEQVKQAVVDVLIDRTYDRHAASEDLWNETSDHLFIAIRAALAGRVIPAEEA